MMEKLAAWSNHETRTLVQNLPQRNMSVLEHPLTAMARKIDIQAYMGRWYVVAEIPSFVTRGSVNNIEDYTFDESRNLICVSFKYSTVDSDGKVSDTPSELKQHGRISNEYNTEWALEVKMVIYWAISMRYLILEVDDNYSTCMIGVADRSMIWIMSRSSERMSEVTYYEWLKKAADLGYDVTQIVRVPFVNNSTP
jgi:apolipoprotein D and lipocalin family protein